MATLLQPTKEQIRDYYSGALERCSRLFAQLEDKDWEKKASEELTARQHLAQLVSSMEGETIPLTRQALAGEKPNIPGFEKRSDMVAFRTEAMGALKDTPASELLARMRSVVEEHLAMLDGISEADLDRPAMSPAWDRPGTVRDLFFAAYLFLPGQYQDIRKVNKKKLPHWIEASTPEQVNYHMERVFHYMPLIFRSDKGADMNVTYQFKMDGAGGGVWSLHIADGRAESGTGPADPFDAEIHTKPELWMDLSNGDLNPVMAIAMRKVKLGGDARLAMKLSELFSAQE